MFCLTPFFGAPRVKFYLIHFIGLFVVESEFNFVIWSRSDLDLAELNLEPFGFHDVRF